MGPCDLFLGYTWNGDACEPVSGCECQGQHCDELWQEEVDCWQAHLICGPSPCAGRDELGCSASSLCKPIYGAMIVQDIDWCVAAPSYVGCSLDLSCAALISYGCMIGDPDSAHQFPDSCLPELGWEPCNPPDDAPPLCP